MSARLATLTRGPALAIALALAVHAGTLGHGFHFDDEQTIVDNPAIRPPVSWRALLTDPASFSRNPGSGMFRPLVVASYAANYAVSGLAGWSWHAANLALHLAATGLVSAAARALGASPGGAGVAALLFGLHPLAAEPVNYISSRSESMALVCILAGFLLYARARRRGDGTLAAAVPLLAFAAGLACKETAATLPLLLAAYELAVLRARPRQALRRLAPYAALLFAYVVAVRGSMVEALVAAPVRGLAEQLATQAKALAYYARLLVVPHPLSVEHPFRASSGWAEAVVVASACLALTWAALAAAAWRRGGRQGVFLLAWCALVLLPTLVVPLNVLVNERRLYPVLAGAAPLLALVAPGVRRVRPGVLAGVAAGLLGLLSLARDEVWASPRSLWQDAAAWAPQATRPHLRLALLDRAAGDAAAAEAHLLAALRLDSTSAPAWNNLGNLLRQRGDLEAAAALYERALALLPSYPEALTNLAAARAEQGRPAEARDLYERALAVQPRRHEIHNNLGALLLRLGRAAEAENHLRRALALRADQAPTWFNLSGALEAQARPGEALAALEQAVGVDPDYAPAWLHMGNLLEAAGRRDEARAAYGTFLERWRGDPEVARRVRARLAAAGEAR